MRQNVIYCKTLVLENCLKKDVKAPVNHASPEPSAIPKNHTHIRTPKRVLAVALLVVVCTRSQIPAAEV